MTKPIDFSYEGDIATLYKGFMYVGRQPFDPEGKGGWFKAYRNLHSFNESIVAYEATHLHLINEMIDQANDSGEFSDVQLEELDEQGRVVSRQYKSFGEAFGVPVYQVEGEEPGTYYAEIKLSYTKLYHCTDASNVDSIMKDGLLSYESEMIFFFPDLEVAEEAGPSDEWAILEVSLTEDEIDKCEIGEMFPDLYIERFGGEPPADTTLREYIRNPIAYGIPEVCCTIPKIPANRIKYVKTIRR